MGWLTYITLGLVAPLALGGVYGALGGSNVTMVVCRGELLVVVPLITTGFTAVVYSNYCFNHCPPRTHRGDAGLNGFIFGAMAGMILGGVIDVGLLIKWLAY